MNLSNATEPPSASSNLNQRFKVKIKGEFNR